MAPKPKKPAAAKSEKPKAAKEKKAASKKSSVPSEPEKALPLGLVLTILGGRNIPKMDTDTNTDAYVEFEYNEEKYKTEVVKDTLCPDFNQKFDLKYEPGQAEQKIKLRMYDHDEEDGDDVIGNAVIDLATLKIGTAVVDWPELTGKRAAGNVGYKICIGDEVEVEQRAEEPLEYVPVPEEPEAPEEVPTQQARGSSFSQELGYINLTIVEGRNLPVMDDGGTSDPYVSFEWKGDPYRTKTKARSLNPIWGETFRLPYDAAGDDRIKSLKLSVWDKDHLTGDDSMGVVGIDMRNPATLYARPVEEWYPLTGLDAGKGELLLRVHYIEPEREVPLGEDAVVEERALSPETIMVSLDIIEARNIRGGDASGLSDAYVSFLWAGMQHKTTVVEQSNEPQWHENFEIEYEPKSDPEVLTLRVYDQDEGTRDDCLGQADIPLNDLSREKQEMWVRIEGSAATGEIKIRISGEPKVTERAVPQPVVKNMQIIIVEAKNLRDADSGVAKSDPYVCLMWGGEMFKTSVKENTLDPYWDEQFDVQYYPSQDPPEFTFRIYDYDEDERHDTLGAATVPIEDTAVDQWYPIDGPSSTGLLRVRYEYPGISEITSEQVQEDPRVVQQSKGDGLAGTIKVEVVRADITDRTAPVDATAVWEWRDRQYTTGTAPSSLSPEWLQAFEQPFDPNVDWVKAFECEVVNKAAGQNENIGSAVVDLGDLVMGEESSRYYDIIKDNELKGRILIRLEKVPEEDVKSDAFASMPPMVPGKLALTIIGATGLLDADTMGKSDPYCVFDWRDHTHRTATIRDNLNPDWNEEFVLPIEANDSPTLELRVFDEDLASSKDDFLGGVVIDLTEDLRDPVENWYNLAGLDNARGQLGVRLHKIEEPDASVQDRGLGDGMIAPVDDVPYATMKESIADEQESVSGVQDPNIDHPIDAKIIHETDQVRYYLQQMQPSEPPHEEVSLKNYEAAPQMQYQTYPPQEQVPQQFNIQYQQPPLPQEQVPQQFNMQFQHQQPPPPPQPQPQYQQYPQHQAPPPPQPQPQQISMQSRGAPYMPMKPPSRAGSDAQPSKQEQFRVLSRQASGVKPCPTCNRPCYPNMPHNHTPVQKASQPPAPQQFQTQSRSANKGPGSVRSGQDGYGMTRGTSQITPGRYGTRSGSQAGSQTQKSRGMPGTASYNNYSVPPPPPEKKGFWQKVFGCKTCGCGCSGCKGCGC